MAFLQGPSLREIELSLVGLSVEEMEHVLGVVQRDLEERQFITVDLEKSDSFKGVIMKHVPIVNCGEEEEEKGEESQDKHSQTLGGMLVNCEGNYERFDDIDLTEDEEDLEKMKTKMEEKEEEEDSGAESDLSLILNELPESERNHIVDVMCRELEMEMANHQKISRLRAELSMLRRKGALKASPDWAPDPSRTCGRCRSELGRIINRGAVCRGCNIRVCKNCRDYSSKGQDWMCLVCRKNKEIAAASGEWVNEFIPNNGKRKTNAKLYVPSTAELLKRNIKRSWTISNPQGTGGPQLTPRNEAVGPISDPRMGAMVDDGRSRPTIVAQIPPPLNRQSRPPGQTLPPQLPLQKQRSAPVRSQSMGVADTGRFYMKTGMGMSGPPPRFRPPPPPDERRPVVHRRVEYNESSSDGEEGPWEPPLVPDYRSWDRRKTQQYSAPHNPGYKTLEPRSRSGGDAQSLERLNNARRVLPELPRDQFPSQTLPRDQFPSHSLPRPGSKRAQSHSTQRLEARPQEARRSQSHGDGLGAESRRRLPSVPGQGKERDLREPTPDYDISPPPSESSRLTGRRNSDSGVLGTGTGAQGVTIRRHASSVEKVGRRLNLASGSSPENVLDSDDGGRKDSMCMSSNSGSVTGDEATLSSLHVSRSNFPLDNNNVHSSNPPSPTLLTIHESDEYVDDSDKDDDDEIVGNFKRGCFQRSSSIARRQKNFKGLRIDLIAAKNRMRTYNLTQNHADNEDKKKIENDNEENIKAKDDEEKEINQNDDIEYSDEDSVVTHSDPDSDYYPTDFENDIEQSIIDADEKIRKLKDEDSVSNKNFLEFDDTNKIMTIIDQTTSYKCSTNINDEWEKGIHDEKINDEDAFEALSAQISNNLSEDEETFESLSMSMEVTDTLSDDEHAFDRLSMCLQIQEDVCSVKDENNSGKNKLSKQDQEPEVISRHSDVKSTQIDKIYPNCSNMNKEDDGKENYNKRSEIDFDVEVVKAKAAISYWENQLAAVTPESIRKDTTSLREVRHNIVQKDSFSTPRSTASSSVTASQAPSPTPLLKAFRSPAVKQLNTPPQSPSPSPTPYSMSYLSPSPAPPPTPAVRTSIKPSPPIPLPRTLPKNSFQRGSVQRSTLKRSNSKAKTPNVVVGLSADPGSVRACLGPHVNTVPTLRKREKLESKSENETPAKSLRQDSIVKKISTSLEQRNNSNPFVDIKTWEERKKEPGWKMPEKKILDWF